MVANAAVSPSSCQHPILERGCKHNELHIVHARGHVDLAGPRRHYQQVPQRQPWLGVHKHDLGSWHVGEDEDSLHILLVSLEVSSVDLAASYKLAGLPH